MISQGFIGHCDASTIALTWVGMMDPASPTGVEREGLVIGLPFDVPLPQ